LWGRARGVAAAALGGEVYAPVGWATHYHANYVVPYWGPKLAKTAVIGTHIFYRFPAPMGLARVYTGKYDGTEPVIALMAGLTTPVTTEVPVTSAIDDATAAAIKPGPVQLDAAQLPIDRPAPTITLPEAQDDTATPTAAPTPAATPTPPASPYFPPPPRRARGRLPM
jgi:spore germination cell wall hydrolase CwlJ-like protein